nr:MAG TPA: hypothetical protein [Caudoviricetes sp.]DAX19202.1 MAG TPA: hypothetical protein [Caudoviricetes sp.]
MFLCYFMIFIHISSLFLPNKFLVKIPIFFI